MVSTIETIDCTTCGVRGNPKDNPTCTKCGGTDFDIVE